MHPPDLFTPGKFDSYPLAESPAQDPNQPGRKKNNKRSFFWACCSVKQQQENERMGKIKKQREEEEGKDEPRPLLLNSNSVKTLAPHLVIRSPVNTASLTADQKTDRARILYCKAKARQEFAFLESEAIELFRQAALEGNEAAKLRMGNILQNEPGRLLEAMEYYRQLIESNPPIRTYVDQACYELGWIYENGAANVPKNEEEAVNYYKQAGNHSDAKAALERLGANVGANCFV